MDHRRLKHSLSLKDLTQISTAQLLASAAAKNHTCVRVPHLFIFASTLQCNLHKPSSIQVTQCNFTLGLGKCMRERSLHFPGPPSMNSISADVDHGSVCLLYRSFSMAVLYHPIHVFLQWDPYLTRISVEIMRVQNITQTTTTVKRCRDTLWTRMRKIAEEIQCR